MFGFKLKQKNMNDFQPLDLMGRGSEAHLQVGDN